MGQDKDYGNKKIKSSTKNNKTKSGSKTSKPLSVAKQKESEAIHTVPVNDLFDIIESSDENDENKSDLEENATEASKKI